jgi:hypothetical protein
VLVATGVLIRNAVVAVALLRLGDVATTAAGDEVPQAARRPEAATPNVASATATST